MDTARKSTFKPRVDERSRSLMKGKMEAIPAEDRLYGYAEYLSKKQKE